MSKTTKTPKYRIFELAKEFNQDSQFLVDFLKKRKIKVANRFSAVDEEAYTLLKENFARRKPAAVETPKVETPKTETPKVETAKTEKPKVESVQKNSPK